MSRLRHRIGRIAQNDPFRLRHTYLVVYRVIIKLILQIQLFGRHVILLGQVIFTAHTDKRVHL